jgi:hypothetical protein
MVTQPSPSGGGTLDFGQAFRFTFDDPEWVKKVLVGAVFVLLSGMIVGAFFLAGYFLRVIQRTARGEAYPLPEWDDLGGLFTDGLKAVGLCLAYGLAAAIIPLSLGCLLVALAGGVSSLAGRGDASELAAGALTIGMVALYGVLGLIKLALIIYLPAALVRLAMTGRFGAGFEVREILSFMGRNLGNYALSLLLFLVTWVLAQFAILLFCVGILPAVFWSYCVLGWALGETVRRDRALSAA